MTKFASVLTDSFAFASTAKNDRVFFLFRPGRVADYEG